MMEATVRGWVEQDGHPLGNVKLGGGPTPDWAFAIDYRPNPNNKAQKNVQLAVVGDDTRERVSVTLQASLSDAHKQAMNSGNIISRGATKRIRNELFLHGIGLSFPQAAGEVVAITLDDIVYYDAPLSKDRFMAMLRRLYGSFLFACDVMSEAAAPGSQGFDLP